MEAAAAAEEKWVERRVERAWLERLLEAWDGADWKELRSGWNAGGRLCLP